MSGDPAKARFIVIQLARWCGVALVLLGMMAIDGKVALPSLAGYGFAIVGLAAAFVLPTLLARRWKTPPQ